VRFGRARGDRPVPAQPPVAARLAGGVRPGAARLRAVARTVQAERAIAMGIVVVAAILVAQIPGRG